MSWTGRASSVVLSLDHAFDLRLRTYISQLWFELPIAYRHSWESHEDFPKFGAYFCFWLVNYQRWHQKLGPILFWPADPYAIGAIIVASTCEASGDSVAGTLSFVWPSKINTLGFAFYRYHRWGVFQRGLRRLTTTNALSDFSFRFTGLSAGWQKGIVSIFDESGGLSHTIQLPTVFCK